MPVSELPGLPVSKLRAVVQEWEAEAAPSAYLDSEEQRTRAGPVFEGLGPNDFRLHYLLLVMRWLKEGSLHYFQDFFLL